MLTDFEMAENLNVSVSKVLRWRLKGGGPRWIRIGSSIRDRSSAMHRNVIGLRFGGGTAAILLHWQKKVDVE